MLKTCYIILGVLFFFTSCDQKETPKDLKDVYDEAGINKTEVDYVINYYNSPEDSLKLKAAKYLLKNMQGLYYFQGEQLNQYLNYVKLLRHSSAHADYIEESFNDLYFLFSRGNFQQYYDLKHFKASDFIKNVDMAFKVWLEQPWGKDITFEQFCEFILPFRIGDAIPENNREEIYKQFNPVLDSVRQSGGDAIAACIAINNKLRSDGWLVTDKAAFLPHFPASNLISNRTGSCRDMTDAAVYIMRAVGIPVGKDLVKQWPYKIHGHEWNIVLNKRGEKVMFMCVDQNPGILHKPGTKKGKVYRQTYALNEQSLAMQQSNGEVIFDFFRNPRLKDVTAEYTRCFDIKIPLRWIEPQNNTFGYLSVFDNSDWVPIHWGNVKNETVRFNQMEGGIVYLPTFYNPEKGMIPSNFPFILDSAGKAKILKPNFSQLNETMILTHIYPFIPDQFRVTKMWNGRLQGANKVDFSDAVDLDTIINALPFWNEVELHTTQRFRYGRYLPGFGYQCDISELEFYGSGVKLNGKAIGSDGSNRPATNLTNILDNDFATRFVTRFSTGSWAGIDFGKQQKIERARYAAGMNVKKNTAISSGETYELLYWGENFKWVSMGFRKAIKENVIYSNVPSNALYLLRNISKPLDKRIFTYQDGKQIWW